MQFEIGEMTECSTAVPCAAPVTENMTPDPAVLAHAASKGSTPATDTQPKPKKPETKSRKATRLAAKADRHMDLLLDFTVKDHDDVKGTERVIEMARQVSTRS